MGMGVCKLLWRTAICLQSWKAVLRMTSTFVLTMHQHPSQLRHQSQDVLRHALGLGADSALHVVSDQELQPLAVARCLAALSKQHQIGLALLGKQAIDDDCNQTVRHSTSGQGGGGCALFLLDPGHGYDP